MYHWALTACMGTSGTAVGVFSACTIPWACLLLKPASPLSYTHMPTGHGGTVSVMMGPSWMGPTDARPNAAARHHSMCPCRKPTAASTRTSRRSSLDTGLSTQSKLTGAQAN